MTSTLNEGVMVADVRVLGGESAAALCVGDSRVVESDTGILGRGDLGVLGGGESGVLGSFSEGGASDSSPGDVSGVNEGEMGVAGIPLTTMSIWGWCTSSITAVIPIRHTGLFT